MWEVRFHPTARDELRRLPSRSAYVSWLRAGRSAWRALYRRVGDVHVVAAVGPEAEADKRGFDRAVTAAIARLAELEEGT